MKKVFRYVGLILALGLLAFMGTCAYNVWKGDKVESGPEPPSISKAPYSLRLTATGVKLYSDKVMVSGSTVGERRYYLPGGYWEAGESKFIFKKIPLTLDERIFGEIEVKKR